MRESRVECRFFTVPEWKKEERYLSEKHKSGWEFTGLHFICLYCFQKCEPKNVVYRLDYNPESVTQTEEYVQMFQDCGWEYLQNYFGYSYFRKPASEMGGAEDEIFCDDVSQLDMVKRVLRQRMVPMVAIFFLIILPQIFIQSRFGRPENRVILAIYCVLLALYLLLFLVFGIQYWKYFKLAREKR